MTNNTKNMIDDLLGTITPEEQAKTDAKMLLAAKIADAMKTKGWKNKDLLKALNKKNPSEITKWLSGTHNFTVDTLVDLENVLNAKLLNISHQKVETVAMFHVIVNGQPIGDRHSQLVNDFLSAESYPIWKA